MCTNLRILVVILAVGTTVRAQQSSDSVPTTTPPATNQSLEERIRIPRDSYLGFKYIRDHAPLSWLDPTPREVGTERDTQRQYEEVAYEKLLIHAAQFDHKDLETHARRDVPFGSLVSTGLESRRLELLSFDGILMRLVRVDNLVNTKKAGIDAIYEAWVFPDKETTPICFFLTQLPPGLEPMKDIKNDKMSIPVRITGYFYKLALYEQTALDPANLGKHKLWAAPVLIGRSLTKLNDGDLPSDSERWQGVFLPLLVGGIVTMGLALVFLSWRYRRGDRAILQKALEKRNQNPFENV